MSDLLTLLIFTAGIACLVIGAWLVVSGGTRIARYLGVAPVVIGLTVVAFGTSAPELFVSLVAALRGNGGLMFGNVVGSNVANIGLILGLTTLLSPVTIESGLIRREIPLLIGVTFLFTALCFDHALSRWDGLVLIVLFAWFMWWTLRSARRGAVVGEAADVPLVAVPAADWLPTRHLTAGETRSGDLAIEGTGCEASRADDSSTFRRDAWGQVAGQVLVVMVGVAGLLIGGRLITDSAVSLAVSLGASETLIGLSLVAVGTSLPELATTVVAAKQGHSDLALGNIIGSNLFNILAVAGPVVVISPVEVAGGATSPQVVSMLLLTLLLALAIGRRTQVNRVWGAVLLTVYALSVASWLHGGV